MLSPASLHKEHKPTAGFPKPPWEKVSTFFKAKIYIYIYIYTELQVYSFVPEEYIMPSKGEANDPPRLGSHQIISA